MFTLKQEWNFTDKLECIVVGLFEKSIKLEGQLAELDEAFGGELTNLLKESDLSAKKNKYISFIRLVRLVPKESFLQDWENKRSCPFMICKKFTVLFFKSYRNGSINKLPFC